jgi:PAS domain S-box-containing protein
MNETKYLEQLGGVLLIAEKDFTVEYCSSQSESILGYSPESICSIPGFWVSKVHAEHQELFANTIEQIKANQKVQTINYLFLVSLGQYRWVQSRIFVFLDAENREKLSVLTIDIHAQQVDFEQNKEERALNTELLKHLSHVFFLFTQKGRFIRWNNRLVDVSGFLDEEIAEMHPLDFFPPEAKPYIEQMIQAVLENGRVEMEALFVARDGSTKPIHFIGSRFIYKGEVCISGVAIDVSLQKNAEEALRKSEQRFRSLVQEGSDMIAILDETGKYLYVSSNYLNIVGFEAEFLLGKNGFDFFHPDDLDQIYQEFLLLQSQKRITSSPYRFKRKDGTWCWLQSTGTNMSDDEAIQGIIVNTVDVTNLIEAQKALSVSNKLYETVNKVTNDAIYDWDIVNDSFAWGEGFSRIFGYPSSDKFTIEDWRQIEHPQDREYYLSAWDEFLNHPNRYKWHCELRVKHLNGNYIYSEEIGHVIRDKSGMPIRMIGVLRDISQRKEQELRKEIQREIAEFFAQDLSLEEILVQTSSYFTCKLNIPIVEVWMNSNDGQCTHKVAVSTQADVKDLYASHTDNNTVFDYGIGIIGSVWQDDRIQIWSGSKLKHEFLRKNLLTHVGVESVVGIPLLSKVANIGQLVFIFQNNDSIRKEWIETLDFLCQQLGEEIARKKQEVELQLLFNSAPDIMAVAGPNGHFVKVNPAFCNLLGYSAEEIISKPFTDFLHPNDVASTTDEYLETIQGERQCLGFLNRYRTKSGRYRWISWSSSEHFSLDDYVFSYGRDVTQMIELQNMLDDATNLSKIGAWEFNIEYKQYYWSLLMREIHGVSTDYDINEESAFAFFRDDFKGLAAKMFDRCIIDFEPFDFEAVITTPQGDERWLRIIGRAEVVNGKCERIFGSSQDIDAQKKIEFELIMLNAELQKNMHDLKVSNKELEQFAFVASHDLQEPLRMVNSFLSLLEKKYKDQLDEKAQSYIHFAVEGAERMRTIILDLLEFSRAGLPHVSKLSEVNLNVVLDDVQILLKKQIEDAGATVDIMKLPKIYGDHSMLRQVFQNLLSNALKYRDNTRRLVVSISFEESENSYTIKVKDNGIGIDEKYHQKVFELFQRLHSKEQYSGNGIGLSITKKIVESLGGKIHLHSEVGQGSTFVIQFNCPVKNVLGA